MAFGAYTASGLRRRPPLNSGCGYRFGAIPLWMRWRFRNSASCQPMMTESRLPPAASSRWALESRLGAPFERFRDPAKTRSAGGAAVMRRSPKPT